MLVLGLGYTGNSRHHIFQRPTCFSHPLHDATLTPLASVFWHMAFRALASGHLCSFGVASFSEIACPFSYCSHTPCLVLLAYGVPRTSLSSQQKGEKGHISLDELGESKDTVGLMYQENYWNRECKSLIAHLNLFDTKLSNAHYEESIVLNTAGIQRDDLFPYMS